MAIINIKKSNIPLKAYLRADSHSQHFVFTDCQGELVDEEMFWGKNGIEGLYLDYSKIQNRTVNYCVGISPKSTVVTKHNQDCDIWIENNISNPNLSKLFVIQGYAGCGKSTFINNLIRCTSNIKSIYVDIGKDWSYPQEPYMFFNESLNEFDRLIEEVINNKTTRDDIWDRFIELGTNQIIEKFDIELKNVIIRFKDIKEEKKWNKLQVSLHSFLFNFYSDKISLVKRDNWHNIGQTQVIVSLMILLQCAKYLCNHKERNSFTLIFDNLDVISNPSITAENIVLLWGVLDRYLQYYKAYKEIYNKDLLNIKMIITVRKVLFSHITSQLPTLEMNPNLNQYNINICDISNLYLSQEILKHRIAFWMKNAITEDTHNKFTKLEEIASVHSYGHLSEEFHNNDFEINSTIDLDALFNHNYRAYSNVLSAFIDKSDYYNLIYQDTTITDKSFNWKKVATQIFVISIIYRKENVWNTMGFGCKDFDTIDYPTTLNRLILNYLFLSKRCQYLNNLGINRGSIIQNDTVSLKKLIDIFSKSKFIKIKTDSSQDEINEEYNSSSLDTKNIIIERLADMCARNPMSNTSNASGYDSDEDELWRRPLYFVGGVKLNHTASSKDELKKYFKESIIKNQTDNIKFSITDEGYILIRDVVAEFEFYSARYCDVKLMKPLHQASCETEINALIKPVYDAIKKCCERNAVFREQYTKNYNINNNKYFKKYFHPRTNPRFLNKNGKKILTDNSFREQLHIVRVLYNHCMYFDTVKEYFSVSKIKEKNQMCECLTNWIEEYLKLYSTHFFSVLKETTCNADNTIYEVLNLLLEEQKTHYKKDGDYKNININIMKAKRKKVLLDNLVVS